MMMFLRSSSDCSTSSLMAGLGLQLGHGGGVALLLHIDHLLQLSDSDLHLLDCSLAGGHRVSLNFLNFHAQGSDFILQSFLGIVKLHQLGLLLSQKTLEVSSIASSFVGAIIS